MGRHHTGAWLFRILKLTCLCIVQTKLSLIQKNVVFFTLSKFVFLNVCKTNTVYTNLLVLGSVWVICTDAQPEMTKYILDPTCPCRNRTRSFSNSSYQATCANFSLTERGYLTKHGNRFITSWNYRNYVIQVVVKWSTSQESNTVRNLSLNH